MQVYGQLTNSPISASNDFFWQLNFADWFAIIVGSIALGLAIGIFLLQRKTESEVRNIERAHIRSRLQDIQSQFDTVHSYLKRTDDLLNALPSLERDNTYEALSHYVDRIHFAESYIKERFEPIRMSLPVELGKRIDTVVQYIGEMTPDSFESWWEDGAGGEWYVFFDVTLDETGRIGKELADILKKYDDS